MIVIMFSMRRKVKIKNKLFDTGADSIPINDALFREHRNILL